MFDEYYWRTGRNGKIVFAFPFKVESWSLELEFDRPVTKLQVYTGVVKADKKDAKKFTIGNRDYNSEYRQGEEASLGFQVQFQQEVGPPKAMALAVNGQPLCCKQMTH